MDQVKIGYLIKNCRKNKNLTQQQLADIIFVSPKTISKWECGNGSPDVSLMRPLCEALDISLNELLSGELIDKDEYKDRAEENFLMLKKMQERDNRLKMTLEIIILLLGFITLVVTMIIAYISNIDVLYARVLGVFGVLSFVVDWVIAILLELNSGVFECFYCKEKFVPKFKVFFISPKVFFYRKLTCPKCGKTSYCKHLLTK